MLRRDLGLTKLYNLVNDPQITDASDPDVARMRAIHVELDEAVMDAYGWSDIPLDHGFHTYRQMERWTVSPAARVEILDRLLEENHRRAAPRQPRRSRSGKGAEARTCRMARGHCSHDRRHRAVEGAEASYELTYELDGSSFTVRENLVDILERELLGPIHGPEEVLPFSPRSQYLVGYIAPVKLTGRSSTGDDADGDGERGDLVEVRIDDEAVAEGRGVPAFAADETEADAEDDDAEDRAPKQGLMIPASMGLRFQVPADLESFTVTASWGTYETVETDKVTKAGRPIRHYQRTPVEESRTIRLADLTPGRRRRSRCGTSICLRVDRYDDPDVRAGARRDRVVQRPRDADADPDRACGCSRPSSTSTPAAPRCSCRCATCWSRTGPSTTTRCGGSNLQYRNRLEFAIGRTCSVDWVVKTGARRATAVWTTWLPVAETPQTRARSVEDALLSMDALSTATPDELRTGWSRWSPATATWLDGQEAAAAQLPAHLRETAELALWEARQAHSRLQSRAGARR